MCFKDQANQILHEHNFKSGYEKELIVKTVLKLICNDIKVANLKRDPYPSVQLIINTQDQRTDSKTDFELICNDIKIANLKQEVFPIV